MTMNMIVSTEFITSNLDSNARNFELMSAHIHIMRKDSLSRMIWCDQNRLEWILLYTRSRTLLTFVNGFRIKSTIARIGIMASPIIIVPMLLRKKIDPKPRRLYLSLRGPSHSGIGKYLL